MMDLIFCLGIAAVYIGIGIIIAISIGEDVEDDVMVGACVMFWPFFLFVMANVWIGAWFIEKFRRK